MSRFDELTWMDATAQAELVSKSEVKAEELVEAAIRRIEQVNPQLNAVVTPMYDLAREAAKSRLAEGPFRGVPFLLKDLLAAYKNVPMTSGSRYLRDFRPAFDSVLVTRYKRAGLIIIGKTNTPEFGLVPTTEPVLFGATRNPWDATRTSGGSSGGSAAAVAAGIVPMAHGNDGGGSIRIPASCCGVFGLKPTRARNPLGPGFGDLFSGLVCEHAITRSVRDSAALLDATSGYDPGDPYCAPGPARPFALEVGADPGRLRIALTTSSFAGSPVHPDCVAAARNAAELCTALGHVVEEAAPRLPTEVVTKSFMTLWAAGNAWSIDSLSAATGKKPSSEDFEPGTWALAEIGWGISGPEYLMAVHMLQAFSRRVAQFMERYDVILTPTLAEPPVPLGTFVARPEDPLAGMGRATQFAPFAALCNATGQPAMSVPLYWNSAGLPIGAHFMGRFGDEATLFRLAAQLERARPWASRRPPVSA